MSAVTVGDKKLSRFKASWLLLKEGWRFLRADSELLLVPVVATLVMVILFACLIIGLLVTGAIVPSGGESAIATQGFIFVAVSYVITAFTVALAQAMVTHTVSVRAAAGNAHFWQSLGAALRHAPTLFLWALITATVGLVLRSISERSPRIGQWVSSLLGAAWGLLSYFVVPAIVLDNKSAIKALEHSAQVFKRTWGESLITSISLSLIFLVMHLGVATVALGLIMLSFKFALPLLFIVPAVLYVIWLFAAIAIEQVLKSIITTLLYVYATTDTPPANFNTELLEAIIVRTSTTAPEEAVAKTTPTETKAAKESA